MFFPICFSVYGRFCASAEYFPYNGLRLQCKRKHYQTINSFERVSGHIGPNICSIFVDFNSFS